MTQTDTETYTFPNEQNSTAWAYPDTAWLRSKYLTIQRAKDENNNYIYDSEFKEYNDNGTTQDNAQIDPITGELEDFRLDDQYIYYVKAFALKDTYVQPAKTGYLLMYDNDFNVTTVSSSLSEQCLIHNSNDLKVASTSGLSHKFEVAIPHDDKQYAGSYKFPLILEDNHQNKYRNHLSKKANNLDYENTNNSLFIYGYWEPPDLHGFSYNPRPLANRTYELLHQHGFGGWKADDGSPTNFHGGASGLTFDINTFEVLHTLNTLCPDCSSPNASPPINKHANKIWIYYGHGVNFSEHTEKDLQEARKFYFESHINTNDYKYLYLNGSVSRLHKFDSNNNPIDLDIQPGDLSNMSFAYIFGCNTGKSYCLADTLVSYFGVKASLGFKYPVFAADKFDCFDYHFWLNITMHKSLQDALNAAIDSANDLYNKDIYYKLYDENDNEYYYLSIFEPVLYGDKSQKLY